MFVRQEDGGHHQSVKWRDWSGPLYGRIDPRLRLLPLPQSLEALCLALPPCVVLPRPVGPDDPPWLSALAAGELGWHILARVERTTWFDASWLRERGGVALLGLDDPARAEAALLARAAAEGSLDRVEEALRFQPADLQRDPETLRRMRLLRQATDGRR